MKIFCTAISAVCALGMAAATAVSVYFASGVIDLVIYLILAAVFFPFSGYLHELGHAIFGSASGMKVSIIKTNMFSSSACSIRPKRGGSMKRRYIVTTVGGLVINFILVLWGIIVLCIPSISNVYSFTAPSSLYLLLLNVMPVEYASGKTDGLAICEAIKNSPSAQVLIAVLEIQGEVASGKQLSEVEEFRLTDLPQLPDDDYNFAMLTALRYQYYTELGDDKTAEIYYMRLRGLGYSEKDFKE
ncbi:MAG: hypothetical protein LUI60_07490 [Clostridia bacterium]|nr:hypothetical protein [Clostridia bacterium]